MVLFKTFCCRILYLSTVIVIGPQAQTLTTFGMRASALLAIFVCPRSYSSIVSVSSLSFFSVTLLMKRCILLDEIMHERRLNLVTVVELY